MNLTAANVNQVFVDCLFTTEEMRQANGNPDPAIIVEGIGVKFGFHPGRLESHRADVASMLSELPPEFMKNGGGGWSFLNACVTKDGVQWGEHQSINELVCLGLGLNMVQWMFEREMWQDLPGGMPYFVVNTDGFSAQQESMEEPDDDDNDDEELSEEEQLDMAVELYESLLCAADGSENEKLNTFEASTIMAMLDNAEYLEKVRSAHAEAYN